MAENRYVILSDDKRIIPKGYGVQNGVMNVYDGVSLDVPYSAVKSVDLLQGLTVNTDRKMNLYDLVEFITQAIENGLKQVRAMIQEVYENTENRGVLTPEMRKLLFDNYQANFPKRDFLMFVKAMEVTFSKNKLPPISLCLKTKRMYDLIVRYMKEALVDDTIQTPKLNCNEVILKGLKNLKNNLPSYTWTSGLIQGDEGEPDMSVVGGFPVIKTHERREWWNNLSNDMRNRLIESPNVLVGLGLDDEGEIMVDI